jgi:ribose-phosphate pyrophosphokinase
VPSYSDTIRLISGTAHPALAEAVAKEIGVGLCDAHVGRFPDGEIDIKINDDVRGTDCFVLQPLSPPVNENWVELLLLLDCQSTSHKAALSFCGKRYFRRQNQKTSGILL